MNNKFIDISIAINITGLAVISAFESWRPGIISGAVNVGLVWLVAVALVSWGLLVKQKQK